MKGFGKVLARAGLGLLALLATMFALSALLPGDGVVFIEILMNFLFGWVWFIGRTTPLVTWEWDGVGMGLLCAAGLLAGGHSFAVWLARATSQNRGATETAGSPGGAWNWRRSMIVFLALPTLFLTTMAAVGLAHQAAWLAASKEPWVQRGGYSSELFNAASDISDWWKTQEGVADPDLVHARTLLFAQGWDLGEIDKIWIIPLGMSAEDPSETCWEYMIAYRDERERARRRGVQLELSFSEIQGRRDRFSSVRLLPSAKVQSLLESVSRESGRNP